MLPVFLLIYSVIILWYDHCHTNLYTMNLLLHYATLEKYHQSSFLTPVHLHYNQYRIIPYPFTNNLFYANNNRTVPDQIC